MTLPLLFFIKEHFKSQNLTIDMYTHLPHLYGLFKNELSIRIFKVNDLYYSSPFKDFSAFRKFKYDYLINLIIGRKALIQTLLFKGNYKIFYIPITRTRLNILFPYLKNYSCKEPSFFKYKKVAEAIINKKKLKWVYPSLKCEKKNLDKLKELININSSKKLIFLNPFVKDFLRNLPIEFYINLISQLKRKNYEPILVGGKDAINVASIIAKREQVKNFTGKLSIQEFICFLNYGYAFITPDSGPMHLSLLSENRKIISLFNFIKPEWRLPEHYLLKKVFPIYLYDFYFSTELKITGCWTEQDQKVAKKLYPNLEKKIIKNPEPLIETILEYLES